MIVNRNKKRVYIYCLIAFVLLFTSIPEKAYGNPSVSAHRAVLMDQETGRVLYEKGAHEKSRIASITKIMTAILAIESGKMGENVKVSENAVGTEGSSIYLQPGEKIKLEDLVYGLMLRSGNDAAVAIAEHVGGSLDGFVYLMNQKAEEIGMKNSHFANPHGLDDHENHLSTAYDMALLTRYAMQNETYRVIAGTKVHSAPDPGHDWDRKWTNKNRLVTGKYKYSTGGKTGYTKRAKRTLVSTASKDNENLIAVTLNAPDDWNDHIQMFTYGFKHFDYKIVLEKGTIDAIEDEVYEDRVYIKEDVVLTLASGEEEDVRVEYKLLKPDRDWLQIQEAPEVVGKANIYLGEEQVKSVPVYFEEVESEQGSDGKEKKSWWKFWSYSFKTVLGVQNNG